MTVQEVLTRCHELGVTLAPGPGGKLRATPPGKLPEELREELKHHKQEILAGLLAEKAEESGKPDYRSRYREMAQKPLFDNYLAVDAWLADHHPALWRKIRELDDELTRLEQEGAEEKVYRAKLGQLLALCQQAQAMKESGERQKEERRTLAVHHCGGKRFWLSAYSDLWLCEKCNPPPDDPKAVKRWAVAGEVITEGACLAQ